MTSGHLNLVGSLLAAFGTKVGNYLRSHELGRVLACLLPLV
jgi:hypothetical protein